MKTVLVLITLLVSVSLRAATYYVSNAGSDSNTGTSPSQAWATVNKVNQTALSPGDTVSFEKGGIWREQLRPQSGSSGNVITYNSYGTGSKPLLQGSFNASSSGEWTSLGGNLWEAGGTTVSNSNLISNPSFATDATGWNLFVNSGSVAAMARNTSIYDSAPASGAVAVTTTGASASDIQLYVTGLSLVNNRIYTLTFRARASSAFTIDAPTLMKQSSPFSSYASATSTWNGSASNVWATYTLTFLANATASDARLNFRVGNVPSGATFYIDDVVLEERTAKLPTEVGSINFNNPSYIRNTSFVTNTTGWTLTSGGGASASFARDTVTYDSAPGGGAVTVTSPGSTSTDIQLKVMNLSLSFGKVYRLNFQAKATASFTLPAPILTKQSSPYSSYASGGAWTGAVTGSWASYSIDLTSTVDANDAQLVIFLGNKLPAYGAFYIDSVTLEELPSHASVDTALQNSLIGFRKGSLAEVGYPGDFWYDYANRRVVLYASANPGSVYSNIECALGFHQVYISSRNYITLDGLALWNAGMDGVRLENAHHITIQNCDIRFIGGAYTVPGSLLRFGNGFQLWQNVNTITLTNNYILNVYDSGLAPQGTSTNQQYDLSFTYNAFLACEMSFELWDRPGTSSVYNLYFENNICRDAGRGWSHDQRPVIDATHLKLWGSQASMSNVNIRYNTFDSSTDWIVWRDTSTFNNIANVVIDNNTYSQASAPGIFGLWGTTTYSSASGSFSSYKTASGKDAASTLTTFSNDAPPSAPRGLVGIDQDQQVTLGWLAQTWASSYNVKRALSSGGPYTTIATGVTTNTYVDTGLTNLTTYYYVVSAENTFGVSRDSLVEAVRPSVNIILDNNAGSGVVTVGSWTTSTANPMRYGANYFHDGSTGGSGGKSVTYSPLLPSFAAYEVYMTWPVAATFASNVPVDINHSGGTTTVTVNQRTGGDWVYLGTFMFPAGTTGNIRIRNDGGNGFVIADAVKFIYIPGP